MSVILFPFALFRLVFQSAMLAVGQIWSRKTRSVLTTTGIIIGISSVTAVIAGLTGFKTEVLKGFEAIGTKRIVIWCDRPSTGPLKYAPWERIEFRPEEFEGILEHCPSVEAVTLTTYLPESVRRGNRTLDSVRVLAIDASWYKLQNRGMILGRRFSLMDGRERRQVCLVTPEVRDKLLLDRDCCGQTVLIGDKTYSIVGVVEPPVEIKSIGLRQDQSEVFVPFETVWEWPLRWLNVEAVAKSTGVADDAKAEITFFLRQTRRIKPGDPDTFGVETVATFVERFNSIATVITIVAGCIVAISLVVGGMGVMNIMLVSVSERTREIGLRKAVGARPSAILLQFLTEALMLCLVGGILGFGFGKVLTFAMSRIPDFPLSGATVPLWAVALSFAFSASVGLFFGIAPAIKAARLDPIEALRHD